MELETIRTVLAALEEKTIRFTDPQWKRGTWLHPELLRFLPGPAGL